MPIAKMETICGILTLAGATIPGQSDHSAFVVFTAHGIASVTTPIGDTSWARGRPATWRRYTRRLLYTTLANASDECRPRNAPYSTSHDRSRLV